MTMKRKRLGEILVDGGVIKPTQLEEALAKQKALGLKLGEALIFLGYVKEEDILLTIRKQLNIPIIDISKMIIPGEILKHLSESIARKYEAMPLDIQDQKLIVAVNDPTNYISLDDIRIAVGMLISPVLAKRNDILKSIDRHYGRSEAEKAAREYLKFLGTSPQDVLIELPAGLSPSGSEEEENPVIRNSLW